MAVEIEIRQTQGDAKLHHLPTVKFLCGSSVVPLQAVIISFTVYTYVNAMTLRTKKLQPNLHKGKKHED